MYSRDETTWGSADGTEYLIKDLTTPHLVNILNWMKKPGASRNHYSEEFYAFMEEEAKYRVLFAFAANEPIPRKLDDGTWILTNISKYQYAKSLFYKHKTEFKLWYGKKKEHGKLLFFKRIKDKIIHLKWKIMRSRA